MTGDPPTTFRLVPLRAYGFSKLFSWITVVVSNKRGHDMIFVVPSTIIALPFSSRPRSLSTVLFIGLSLEQETICVPRVPPASYGIAYLFVGPLCHGSSAGAVQVVIPCAFDQFFFADQVFSVQRWCQMKHWTGVLLRSIRE